MNATKEYYENKIAELQDRLTYITMKYYDSFQDGYDAGRIDSLPWLPGAANDTIPSIKEQA